MCLAMNATVRIGTMKNDDNQQMKPNKIPEAAPHGAASGILLGEGEFNIRNQKAKEESCSPMHIRYCRQQ